MSEQPKLDGSPMRQACVAVSALVAIGLLAGCSSDLKSTFGLSKRAPDEFAVPSRAPLSLPPDYSLRPPEPGAPRPNQTTARQEAERTVFRREPERVALDQEAARRGLSQGEAALLSQANALNADESIRATINRESAALVETDESFSDKLMFWRPAEAPGTLVDAQKETERLRENAALGKDATEGETPTIRRRKKAILEGIFN
jgi:hypothetical protein